MKQDILVRPSGKLVRIAALPSCLGSWDTETVPLAGHQPLFPVCPVAHTYPSPLGKGESKQATTGTPASALTLCHQSTSWQLQI